MGERASVRVVMSVLALAAGTVLWWAYGASWGIGLKGEFDLEPVVGSQVMPGLLVLALLAAASGCMLLGPWQRSQLAGGVGLAVTGAAALWLGMTGTPVHGRSGIYELTSCSGSNDLCEIVASGQYATVLAGALLGTIGILAIVRARRV